MGGWLVLKEYLDNSTIHGLQYLTENGRHIIERLFWMVAVALSCFGTYMLTMASYHAYKFHSISFSMETDYLYWNTSFAAISVCEINDNDGEKALYLLSKNEEYHKYLEDYLYEAYVSSIGFYDGSCKVCEQIVKKNITFPLNFTEITKLIHLPCEKLISNCKWNGEPFNCCESFDLLESEMGPCYNLNGMTNTKPQPKMISNRATGPGRLSFEISTYVKVFIHSPEDVPYINTWRDEVFVTDDLTDIEVIFAIKEIHNDRGVSDVSLDRRDCRFPTENNLWVHPYYSYSACIVQCRGEKEYELCNCTNHLMPNSPYPVCDDKGLICLGNYSHQLQGLRFEWLTNKVGLACSCAASCVEPEYNILKFKSDNTGDGTVEFIMHSLPIERFKRSVIRSSLDLVVSIGGAAGLFLGASLLSIAELFIYFCIRPCSATIQTRLMQH